MMTEFHRTAALFEEFKKREIHFLNTEMNLKSNGSWKNYNHTAHQDYLQKINKQQQELEKTYEDSMRQMEILSKQADQMSLKLEKLNSLRIVGLSSNTSAWPSIDATCNRPSQSFYSNSLLQTTPKMLSSDVPISDFPPKIQTDVSFTTHPFQRLSSKLDQHSITTQTEYIFCDHCHFPLILNLEKLSSNSNLPTKTSNTTVTKKNEQSQSLEPTKTQENQEFPREAIVTKSILEINNLVPTSNHNFSGPQVNDHGNTLFINEQIPSGLAEISLQDKKLVNEQVGEGISRSYFDDTVTGDFTNTPVQKRMSESFTNNAVAEGISNELAPKIMSKTYIDNVVTDEPTNVSAQKRMPESYIDNTVTGDFITHREEKQYIEIQDSDLQSNDGNFEQTISKSDDESMSREFNFLDSDKSKIPKSQPFHQMSGDINNQLSEGVKHQGSTELEASYATKSNPDTHLLKVQQISGSGEKIGVGPSSPSAHSENTSIVSESDSFSETETPLTATAAYQALLGNVSVAKPKQKSTPISESDSEDEIENALANAVRRTSRIAFDTATLDPKTEKRKESIVEMKAERHTKSADSVSTNKPQNKLSKNTRKVLGLDTSSGSEMELEVKSPTSKIEEESDEFDFYD